MGTTKKILYLGFYSLNFILYVGWKLIIMIYFLNYIKM